MAEQPPVEAAGVVSRILYSNPDNFYTVLLLDAEDGRSLKVVGTLAGVSAGEHICVRGAWSEDPRFGGQQLKASGFEVKLPTNEKGIKGYLSSGVIPGIGPKTADLLYGRFGDEVLEVIDGNPERLKQVRGVGKKKIAQIVRSWREHRSAREAMVFFQSHGISNHLMSKLRQQYGDDAVGVVRGNPYRLIEDLPGVGFKRADAIARELGLSEDHPRRTRAGLIHTLKEARKDGSVCLPRDLLLESAAKLLSVDIGVLAAELTTLVSTGRVVLEDDELVYTPDLFEAEKRAAAGLIRLLDHPKTIPGDVDLSVLGAQAELGVELADGQRAAVRSALTQPVTVITGGPGTGKTTIIRAIVRALESFGETVLLGAPTGRAAKRLGQATGKDAKTLHRLLEWQPGTGFARNADTPLNTDAVIIDEVSMVDLKLFDCLLTALKNGTRLILVGDVDQLPSVGAGSVLRDVIDSKTVPVARLMDIFRQAEGSLIIANAHRILAGQFPVNPPPGVTDADFYFVEQNESAQIAELVVRVVVNRIPSRFGLDPAREVQVLTPMHRGDLGSEGLNRSIGAVLNPGRGNARLAPGDKVMQIRNNYEKEVFNGDVGFVERVAEDRRTLLVRFEESDSGSRLVHYEPATQDQLIPAWAISIHKSQGSEYPAVVIPLHGQHYMMLKRNLLYTAVTRGRRLVVIVGSSKALNRALKEATMASRYGSLAQRLRVLGQ
ncbi:MAG: exodeoxyribonuclease V alpha subunit [Myxococcota bacterium]|jgi:exodeoxyribonuclease V alpha subunit